MIRNRIECDVVPALKYSIKAIFIVRCGKISKINPLLTMIHSQKTLPVEDLILLLWAEY